MIRLTKNQEEALEKLFSGAILLGNTGSGKTYTGLFFYKNNYMNLDLYIITTARKRDDKDFEKEASDVGIKKIIVDSWNNIQKYTDVKQAFFIFDEQRTVGYGKWSKSFIKIAKNNKWIMLTATPGDRWIDYMSVFIANGFYKNKKDFVDQHVEYNPYVSFAQIKKYHNVGKLIKIRDSIVVKMDRKHKVNKKRITVELCKYDKEMYKTITKKRWNIKENRPILNVSELLVETRKIINTSEDRIEYARFIISIYDKIIVFYNFDYELEILKMICQDLKYDYYQWNGHKHEPIPKKNNWVYLVQYTSGSEAWNCIETDTILFYSLNYSYRIMTQSEGRIDRLNTPFNELYYYYLIAPDSIDYSIMKAIKNKKNFNANVWSRKC